MGQPQRERRYNDQLAQRGEKDGVSAAPKAYKGALAYKLKGHKEIAVEKQLQRRNACFDQARIACENAHELARKQHDQQPCGHRNGQRGPGDLPNAAAGAAVFLGAVIVADHRLAAVRKAGGGQLRALAHRVDHRHHAHIQIAAHHAEHGVAHHLRYRVGDSHQKAGKSQRDHLLHQRPVHGKQILPVQPENGVGAGKETQHPHTAHALADHGGQRCAAHAHAQHKNKNRVQHKIQHAADHGGHHAHPAKALSIDKAVHAQRHHVEHCAQKIDLQIGLRIGPCAWRCAERKQNGPHEPIKNRHQRRAGKHFQHQTVVHNAAGGIQIARAAPNAAQRRTALPV